MTQPSVPKGSRIRLKLACFIIPLLGCASVACGTAGSSDQGNAAGASGNATAGRTGSQPGEAGRGGSSGLADSPGAAPVSIVPSAAASAEFLRIRDELQALSSLDASGFETQTRVPFSALGSYEPSSATGMNLVQNSAVALNAKELNALDSDGFVVSPRQSFPSFMYGYKTIYSQDLPLYVSADSILYAVHKSYDAILSSLERRELTLALNGLLTDMGQALSQSALSGTLRSELDVYLTTARSLLAGEVQAPHDPKVAARVSAFVKLATEAAGPKEVEIFGLSREVDFSQFKPRGHYVGFPALERYFRAMMWLGRIDLRVIDVDSAGNQSFVRSQLEAAVALRQLMSPTARTQFAQIDDVVTAFVGEHDDMTPTQVDGLLTDLGASGVADLAGFSNTKLAQAVIDGGYGAQRIASQIAENDGTVATLPLARSFAFLGQRYVLDSHVLSNVSYDRVNHEGLPYRLMPNPLDVAYAALNNNHAGMLLGSELEKYGYAPELQGMRVLSDEHGADFWNSNLYNLWLGALRTLSPSAAVAKPAEVGLPTVAGTEGWGRRLLNTQLASWAELRHDTLLYAKQSYSAGSTCEFPSAYVEPYPEFFSAVLEFSIKGRSLAARCANSSDITSYFSRLGEVATLLRDMAQNQRAGLPLTQAQLDFINRAVSIEQGCGTPFANGWYSELFYDRDTAIEADPTIADVHTQPLDENGNPVGHVLHVGVGAPQLMVVTVDSCTGSHAYVGLVSSYYEHITKDFERLSDPDWVTVLEKKQATPPTWLPPAFAY